LLTVFFHFGASTELIMCFRSRILFILSSKIRLVNRSWTKCL